MERASDRGSAAALSLFFALAAAFLTLAQPGRAGAQPLEPSVVIVVDFQLVLRESDASRSIQQQIDERRDAYQGEFAQIEQDLRTAEAAITAERPGMTAEEFEARRRDFEQRVVDAQREAQARHTALDDALDLATNRVREALLQTIADIAQQVGAKIVLNKNQVILTDRGLDFTQQVMDELNRRLPRVDVVMPAP